MGLSAEMLVPRPVRVEIGETVLNGDLTLPAEPRGLVIFAHGSGSSRHSSRNRAVAEVLQHGHCGTLLLDLLTRQEEAVDDRTSEFRFDIPLLAERVAGAVDWASAHQATEDLRVGLFGASTGAAAALIAAAQRPSRVAAVVSRGGRADLANRWLESVSAPTLLIVGEQDDVVVALNREALEKLQSIKALEIVPGATHLFEEPGALERVAQLARDWFNRYIA
jgi:putative phosphoribosyl transferase